MTRPDQTACWVDAARQGDRLAMAKLLALHHPQLAAHVAAKLDPAAALRASPEDVLQEAYIEVFRGIARFEDRGPGSFLSWVTTIVDHKLHDVRRAAHRKRRDVARESPAAPREHTDSYRNLLDQVYHDSITPSRVFRQQEAIGALRACLDELSESHRRVIESRFLQGRPLGEVARELEKSEDAVVALTQRALAALRAAMDRRGDFTHGG
jgi:RNA polymerase sigma-70 factor, ECF subfamily